MTCVHVSQLAFFWRDESGDQRDESIRSERRESHRDSLHDGAGLEPIDVRRVERALHDAGEHAAKTPCPDTSVIGYVVCPGPVAA